MKNLIVCVLAMFAGFAISALAQPPGSRFGRSLDRSPVRSSDLEVFAVVERGFDHVPGSGVASEVVLRVVRSPDGRVGSVPVGRRLVLSPRLYRESGRSWHGFSDAYCVDDFGQRERLAFHVMPEGVEFGPWVMAHPEWRRAPECYAVPSGVLVRLVLGEPMPVEGVAETWSVPSVRESGAGLPCEVTLDFRLDGADRVRLVLPLSEGLGGHRSGDGVSAVDRFGGTEYAARLTPDGLLEFTATRRGPASERGGTFWTETRLVGRLELEEARSREVESVLDGRRIAIRVAAR